MSPGIRVGALLCGWKWRRPLLGTAPPALRGLQLGHFGRSLLGRGKLLRGPTPPALGGGVGRLPELPLGLRALPPHSAGHRVQPRLTLLGLIF